MCVCLMTFSSDFMAWTIRHGAVLGLSRVCHTCKQLAMKDGLSSVAWSTLMNGHSTEKDTRVLEAFRMSQVHVHVHYKCTCTVHTCTCMYMYMYSVYVHVHVSCMCMYTLMLQSQCMLVCILKYVTVVMHRCSAVFCSDLSRCGWTTPGRRLRHSLISTAGVYGRCSGQTIPASCHQHIF